MGVRNERDEANGGMALGHWRLESDADEIVWLHFDRAGASDNVLDAEALRELDAILADLGSDAPYGLGIVSDKLSGFCAGTDVRALTRFAGDEEAYELFRFGQSVFDRLEYFPSPTVAAIHGYCLGGGLELALACRYRVTADADVRLGAPEVRLGLHPAFGGTLRLPRLLGALPALDLMLSGREIGAAAARRVGLVDHVAPAWDLRTVARGTLLEAAPARRPPLHRRVTGWVPLRPLLAERLRQRLARRAPPAHYPAPHALIGLWREHWGAPLRLLEAEARSAARLVTGATAQNLIRVHFLQERLKGLAPRGQLAVRRVHVLGAGTMGAEVAAWCALHGAQTTLYDLDAAKAARAVRRAHARFRERLEEPYRIRLASDSLQADPDGSGVAWADLVIEAVPENLSAKRAAYRAIEPRVGPYAWLATCSASVPLAALAAVLDRPQRLVGLHFCAPLSDTPVVEVVQGVDTDPAVARRALAFVRQVDRLPLPVAGIPGLLVNRMLIAALDEAILLESEGVPRPVVDRAATDFGMSMGPLLRADLIGLDVCLSVAEALAAHRGGTVPERLHRLVQAGRLGRKSGQGFYRYQAGRPLIVGRAAPPAPEVTDRLVLAVLNEGLACLREGVVEDAGLLDAGAVLGAGFPPFRGGPVRYIDETGRELLRGRLSELEARHGPRFAPDPGWEGMLSVT
jgi:3-hydroxyacyl-CoA dehydrogenase / enoyl-CoA hydratase / 3-hydroxybutyryl-CoA epimerase